MILDHFGVMGWLSLQAVSAGTAAAIGKFLSRSLVCL